MAKAIMMDPKDNVATLLASTEKDEVVTVSSTNGKTTIRLKAKQQIPFGHKIALVRIEENEKVIKYGEVIGETTTPIEQGEHVHVQNVRSITWGKFK